MSSEEQFAAIGRIVDDYQQCKARLAALTSEAEKQARSLRGIAEELTPSMPLSAGSNPNPCIAERTIDLLLETFPSREHVHQMLVEIYATFEKKKELQRRLKEVGLDLRD